MNEVAPAEDEYSRIFERLSAVGKRLPFPSRSVLFQAAQNRHTTYNGSAGVTTQNGQCMHLPLLTDHFKLNPSEAVRYTQSDGLEELRSLYKQRICNQNALDGELFGSPVITNGITHALHIFSQLMLDRGDTLVVHDPYWENYDLIFADIADAQLKTYPLFDSRERFNLKAFRQTLGATPGGSAIVVNFPNNPTGFSPDRKTMFTIADTLHEVTAERRCVTPIIIDEAGYGFFFETDVCRESLFSLLVKCQSDWLLPVLAKGSTKEDLSYGLRIGCLTFGVHPRWSAVLEAKVAALIRGEISTVCTPSQLAVARAIATDPARREAEFKRVYDVLNERYQLIKHVIIPELTRRGFAEHFYIYPFNSGFFITLQTKVDAYKLQKHLRWNDVGVTVLDKRRIRISFSSVDTNLLPRLFDIILETVHSFTADCRGAP